MDAGATLRPGLALGRYECLMPVARGGMASVWAGRLRGPRGFERLVAIKTILPLLADDPSFVQMFLEEARLTARIQHPNVVPVLDLGEQGEVLYLVLEWVEGEPLSLLLREALSKKIPVPLEVAGRIAVDICAGLHAAHELCSEEGEPLGLVHRDVSPQNVLISSDGQVKLVDFGVAKATLRSVSETAPGVLKGKTGYIAPEQALSLPVDRRADLFAVGVLFFQMVAGRHPFRGENDVATITNLLSRSIPSPSAVAGRALPAALDVVILRSLARNREERFPDAMEMARAIEVALRGQIASTEQVAAFLAQVVGERIATRRKALRQAISEVERGPTSGEITSPSLSSIQLVSPDVSARWSLEPGSLPSVPGPPSAEVSAPAVETPLPGRSSPRPRWFAAGMVALGLAILGALGLSSSRQSAPAPVVASGPLSSVVAVAPAPELPASQVVPAPPVSASAAPSAVAPVQRFSDKKRKPARPLRPGGQGKWAQPVSDPGF